MKRNLGLGIVAIISGVASVIGACYGITSQTWYGKIPSYGARAVIYASIVGCMGLAVIWFGLRNIFPRHPS